MRQIPGIQSATNAAMHLPAVPLCGKAVVLGGSRICRILPAGEFGSAAKNWGLSTRPRFWASATCGFVAKIGVCYTIRPADYLLHKGVSTNNGYTQSFIDITNELLSTKQASVRTCNKFTDPIKKQLDYTDTHQSFYGNGKARLFPNLCLLPILNVLVYFEPLGWYEVKTNANFSSVYELAKHSKDFIQCLDMVIEEVWGSKKDKLPYKQDTEARHKRFVEDACALVFVSDYRDPRIEELCNRGITYTEFDQELFRHLTPPSNE